MSEQNVHFWGISTGNEPLNGVIGFLFVHFMSLGWTAVNQVYIQFFLIVLPLYEEILCINL